MPNKIACFGIAELHRAATDELPWLARLRSQASVRRWFFDTRDIPAADSIRWLSEHMNDPLDTIFVVRRVGVPDPIGSIGLICISTDPLVIEIGRLALDISAARRILRLSGVDMRPLMQHACFAIREYSFSILEADLLRVVFKPENHLTALLSRNSGLSITEITDDGHFVAQLDRPTWASTGDPQNENSISY